MRLLVDTNIIIAHEDDDPDSPHVNARAIGTLVELSRALGFELLTSHGTRSDFARAVEPYRAARMRALRKYYAVLEPAPSIPIVREHFWSSLTP
jgi:predicted nucleic acid-binding protein